MVCPHFRRETKGGGGGLYIFFNTTLELVKHSIEKVESISSFKTGLFKRFLEINNNLTHFTFSLLVLPYISDILLSRLQSRLGVNVTVLSWFESYLSGRSQRVYVNGSFSKKFGLDCGVPQGSCLGPLLFNVYASKLFDIVSRHLLDVHCYVDDSQLYLSFSPNSSASQEPAVNAMECCIREIRNWMRQGKLMLNADKTEFIIIRTRQQLAKINIELITVGSTT